MAGNKAQPLVELLFLAGLPRLICEDLSFPLLWDDNYFFSKFNNINVWDYNGSSVLVISTI